MDATKGMMSVWEGEIRRRFSKISTSLILIWQKAVVVALILFVADFNKILWKIFVVEISSLSKCRQCRQV